LFFYTRDLDYSRRKALSTPELHYSLANTLPFGRTDYFNPWLGDDVYESSSIWFLHNEKSQPLCTSCLIDHHITFVISAVQLSVSESGPEIMSPCRDFGLCFPNHCHSWRLAAQVANFYTLVFALVVPSLSLSLNIIYIYEVIMGWYDLKLYWRSSPKSAEEWEIVNYVIMFMIHTKVSWRMGNCKLCNYVYEWSLLRRF